MKTQLCRLNWRIATLLITTARFLPCIFCDKTIFLFAVVAFLAMYCLRRYAASCCVLSYPSK
jgi:hypothetical protein